MSLESLLLVLFFIASVEEVSSQGTQSPDTFFDGYLVAASSYIFTYNINPFKHPCISEFWAPSSTLSPDNNGVSTTLTVGCQFLQGSWSHPNSALGSASGVLPTT